MTKVIWLGEDSEDQPGPSYTTWNGVRLPKGKPVEVTDPHMLAKARGNRFYKVIEDKPAKRAKDDEGELVNIQGSIGCNTDIQPPKQEDDMADVKRHIGRKPQEKKDAQTKAQELTDKAQDLKAKVERKKYNYRKAEKGSGYSPQKPKTKKEKATGHPADNADP